MPRRFAARIRAFRAVRLAGTVPSGIAVAGLPFVALFLASLPSALPARAAEWSVRPDGTGDVPTIQAAVDAAAPLDEIVLEDGVFRGDGNRDIQFFGKDVVVRSRNGPSACTIDTEGSLATPHRAFRLNAQETAASRIAGLTITGGYTTGPFPECGGAGILVEYGTHPVIENCMFEANEAGFQGFGAGLLAWEDCDITLRDCTFSNGVSGWYGGGFTLRKNCDGLVERCLVTGNWTQHGGGGASITRSNAILNDCVFVDNEAADVNGDGGGLLVKADARPVLTRCVFAGNRAHWGAGLGIGNFPVVTAIDCLFENNTATVGGGGVEVGQDPSTITLTNCTFAFNQASFGAHVFFASTATGTLRNSILGPFCGGSSGLYAGGVTDVDCCVVPGGLSTVYVAGTFTWGPANVDADPRFCAPDPLGCTSDPPVEGDYGLQDSSPAAPGINACGLVGAFPVSCGTTSVGFGVEALPWSRVKARYRDGGR